MKTITSIFIILTWASTLPAQSPYTIQTNKEIVLYGAGISSLGIGIYTRSTTDVFTASDILLLDRTKVNTFDRIAIDYSSQKAHRASNIFWYGSYALPGAFIAIPEIRKDWKKIAILYGETAFITAGITVLTKYTFRRARPFNYRDSALLSDKTTLNARGSFVSGHTSLTSANCFFAAKVYSDYFPESRKKYIVWGAAATIPAVTGYLRVRAGRHYPTDVIGGYLLGAAAGVLVPHLHKNKVRSDKLTLSIGYESAYLKWVF